MNLSALDHDSRDYTPFRKEGWLRRVNDPPRVRPPDLTRAALRRLSRTDRLVYDEARKTWHANLGPIPTPAVRQLLDSIDEVVDTNRQDGDKVKTAAVLDAWPGLGKSTIAISYGVAFHRREVALHGPTTAAGDERLPVCYIGLNGRTTMRSLNQMLCRFYGHPGAQRGSAQTLGDRATDCILACGTKLVIVDDVHFLNINSKDGRALANHFKWLANQFPVTFLYVGVGVGERGLITEGLHRSEMVLAQTARRWTRLGLDPFEIRTRPGRQVWTSLLKTIELDLVLAEKHPGMLSVDLADYLYDRSTGHFASLMSLIARGARRAVIDGAERITRDLLDTVRADDAAEASRQTMVTARTGGRTPAAKTTRRDAAA